MPIERYYSPQTLKEGETIALKGQEAHHLHVMRGRVGDLVEIVNGKGTLAHAKITHLTKETADLLLERVELSPPPAHTLILAQALPRQNRLEWIVEKGTELGMTEIWLFPGERSEKKALSENHHQRLIALTIAAMKQCGRLFLPSIFLKPSLSEWALPLPFPAYFGDIRKEAKAIPPLPKKEVLFFNGPEMGFSSAEEAALTTAGALGVTLSENILRTDTAALAALAIFSSSQC